MNEARVGRPPLKKGRSSWKPASLNEFYDKEAGYRYRMVAKTPANLAKKKAEGWETVSGIQSSQTKHQTANRIEDGKALTSVQEGHDWILMRLDETSAKERDAYHNEKSERMTAGLTAHLRKGMDKSGVESAPIHGDITISSRKGTTVIE